MPLLRKVIIGQGNNNHYNILLCLGIFYHEKTIFELNN